MKISSPSDNPRNEFKFFDALCVSKGLQKFQAESDGPMDSIDNDEDVDNGSAVLFGNETEKGKGDAVKIVKKGEVKAQSGFHTLNRRKRPTGRKSEKEDMLKDENTKQLKLAASSLSLQHEQFEAMKNHNEMLAFSSIPGGAETRESREYFSNLLKEMLVAATSDWKTRKAKQRNLFLKTVSMYCSTRRAT